MPIVTEFFPNTDGEYRSNIASEAVQIGLDKYTIYGDSTLASAIQFLEDLKNVTNDISDIPQISDQLGDVLNIVNAYVAPALPVEPDIIPNYGTAPADPVLGSVGAININQDAPTFDKADPTIREIAPPEKFTKSAPVAPTLPDHALPNTRELIIPDTPTSRAIVLPDNVQLIDFAFTGTEPGALEAAPDVSFNYAENKYTSTLLTALNTRLLDYVDQNITGLDPTIEQQLWDRGRERTTGATDGQITQITRVFSALGWDQPIGDQIDAINQATQNQTSEDIAESRNIAITQANLIQQKFHTALAMALQNEAQLIGHNDNFAQRAFEAARYTVQAAIDIYGLKVSQFNAEAQVFQTYANVFKIRVDADLARLEQQKVQLEAQKLVSDLNQQDIDKFKVEIESLVLIQSIFNDELEAVRIRLEQDRLKIQNYEGTIRGFESEIKAKSLEYEGYRDEQQGELLKATTHETLAKIYDTKMNGYKILADTEIAIQASDILVKQELPLEVSKVLSEIFKITNEAESDRIKALTDLFNVRAGVYDTEVKGESSRVESEVAVQKQEIEKLIAESDIRIESLKGNISSMLAQVELAISSTEAGARVATQLASAALNTVSISAGVNEGATNNSSRTTTYSVGNRTSHSHNKTYTD